MTPRPVVRFLEEFAPPLTVAVNAAAADSHGHASSGEGGLLALDRDPAKAGTAPGGGPGGGPSGGLGGGPAVDAGHDQAIAAAREEGGRAAREELEPLHRQALEDLEARIRQEADATRQAEIEALAATIATLFSQYDDWLDRMFEAGLRPIVKAGLERSALDAFKAQLLESVDRKGMSVLLGGPARLVGEMARLLEPHGLEISLDEEAGGSELWAKFETGTLRTRLGTIGDLLPDGEPASPERGDD